MALFAVEDNIIDTFTLKQNLDFKNFNIKYSWLEEEYITEYQCKIETNKRVFLVCSKLGNKKYPCPRKS